MIRGFMQNIVAPFGENQVEDKCLYMMFLKNVEICTKPHTTNSKEISYMQYSNSTLKNGNFRCGARHHPRKESH